MEQKIKKLYAGLGWVSLFTNIRFWTGSFRQIERVVPKRGKIIDLGCGYGIFTNFIGLCSPKRKIIGIDMDGDKISYADRGLSNVTFRIGDATKMGIRNLTAIILMDVLHHLESYKAQEQLIQKATRLLAPYGKLIISEVDSGPMWKLILARIADFLLYPNQSVHYGYRKKLLPILEQYFGKQNIKVTTLKHNPFPHILYECVKQ